VSDAGVAVVSARPLRTIEVGRYAHRVNEHAVVRPYAACLWLGDLATPTTVAAIGQSRHLGGGLLVPYDVPEGTPLAEVGLLAADGSGRDADT
jgi:CRISPR-associated protein Csb2